MTTAVRPPASEPIPDWAYLWRPFACREMIYKLVERPQATVLFVIDPWTQRWAIVTPETQSLLEAADGKRRLSEIIRALRGGPLREIATVADQLRDAGLLLDSALEHRASGRDVYNRTEPTGFHLEITNACNMRCEHCYVSSGRRLPEEMSLEEIFRAVDMLPPFSGKRIAISGGEPAVRRDCAEIVEYCIASGHDVDLYTNGKRFPEALADRIGEINRSPGPSVRIQMSLEGATAQTNDLVRGRGSFDHAIRSLEMFRRLGVNRDVVIFCCLTKHNISQVDDLIALAERHDVGMLVFSQWQRQGNAKDTPWATIAPSTEAWVAAGERLLAYDNPRLTVLGNFFGDLNNNELGRLSLERPLFPKHVYYYNAFPRIAPDGKVWADQLWVDEDWVLGNVREQPLERCFETPKFAEQLEWMRDRIDHVPACQSCEWRELCQCGSPGHTYAEYGHMNERDLFCESRIYWFERYVETKVDELLGSVR